MRVSTDGVMLGAWAELGNRRTLLDIGTGTGLLALMCAQRYPDLAVTAIDIDDHAIAAARHNLAHSPWPERISLQQGDVLSYPFEQRFDAIICNPPYFLSGEQASNRQRATARHADQLDHGQLLVRCRQLLTPTGTASFILPKTEGDWFIRLAEADEWYVRRLTSVQPTEHKPVSRYLIELSLLTCELQAEQWPIQQCGQYSAEFVRLTRAFYLKM